MGARHLPVAGGVLEARYRRIAADLGATGFKGSPYFIQNWARRYNLLNVALWGQDGSVDTEAAAPRIAQIQEQLEAYPPDRIYNTDETGLFYRCIPNRAYVQAGRRRQAQSTKAMKAKDRATLVLACNATRAHKIPATMIGKAKQPLCFKPPGQACPLPYFSQPSAWMDGDVFQSRLETVFLPAVRARTTLPVALIYDNCGAHEELESIKVTFIPLPPSCTAIYQPLDLGIIACLKRRYKRRLLDLVVGVFEITLGNQTRTGAGLAAGTCLPVAPEPGAPVPLSTAGVSTGVGSADAVPADEATGVVISVATAKAPLNAPVVATEVVAGGWLLAECWWQSAGDAANEQPLNPVSGMAPARVGSAAAHRAAPLQILREARAAVSRAAAAANVLSTAPYGTAAAETRAGGRMIVEAAEQAPQARVSGLASEIYGASGHAADGSQSEDVSAGGTNPLATAAAQRIWGWPSDLPAAPSAQELTSRRSRARATPVVIRGFRDGAAVHLQDASDIVTAEWDAVEASTMAHCWVKSTILPHAIETVVIALHGEFAASSRSLGTDGSSVVSHIEGCRFREKALGEDPAHARELAMQNWLTEEDDEEVRAATGDRIFFEQKRGGETGEGEGIDEASGSDSE